MLKGPPNWRRYVRFWGTDHDADVSDEFRFHLETEIEELVARGMTPDEARADALRRFGDVAYYREYCKRADARRTARGRRAGTWDVFRQDLRAAWRAIIRQPGFAIIAVVTLGLGIGANTAIFSVLHGVVLSPLEYREPDRLVTIWESMPDAPQIMVSYPDYRDWRTRAHVFEDIAIYNGYDSFNATGDGDAERIRGGLASANLFSVLGVSASIGRVFSTEEDRREAEPVVVIANTLWQRRYAASPGVIGQTLTLDGNSYRIIGVLPASFKLAGSELWLPIGRFTHLPRFDRSNHPGLLAIGRLKPGVTLQQMRTDLSAVAKQLEAEYPGNRGIGAGGELTQELIVGSIRPALIMLSSAVGLVLLVACANVANLLLARAAVRQREFALRVAIGAGRSRLVRQLLTESIVLALMGGALGVALAWAGVKLLIALHPSNIPRLSSIHVNATVLAFTLLVSLATGVLFGLAPAIAATHSDPIAALREGSRGSAGGRTRVRMRSGLTVAEIAMAVVLLVGSGLLLRSFTRLIAIDPGFSKEHVLAGLVQLPNGRYPSNAAKRAAFEQMLAKVRTLPGVTVASVATDLPISSSWQTGLSPEGAVDDGKGNPAPLISAAIVSPGFFATVQTRIVAGRDFDVSDREGQPSVIILSRSVAQRFFNTENAVGRRVKFGGPTSQGPWLTVVGVVNDVKNYGLRMSSPGQFYLPIGQSELSSAWLMLRSDASIDALGPELRAVVRGVDRELPVAALQTLEQAVNASIAQPKFSMLMLTIFALVALVLAAVGIYGVVSYGVTQRTRELGVRIALGAHRATVLRMIVREGIALSIAGVTLGVAAAFAGSRLIAKQLYGISNADPVVYAGAAVVIVAISLAASAIPAVRATRVDPVEALRRD
jgi:putative ABC transport system permease protein